MFKFDNDKKEDPHFDEKYIHIDTQTWTASAKTIEKDLEQIASEIKTANDQEQFVVARLAAQDLALRIPLENPKFWEEFRKEHSAHLESSVDELLKSITLLARR